MVRIISRSTHERNFMIQIRLSMLCLVLSAICLTAGHAEHDAWMNGSLSDTAAAAETETEIYSEAAVSDALMIAEGEGVLYEPMSVRYLDDTPLLFPEPREEEHTAQHVPAPDDIVVTIDGGTKEHDAYLQQLEINEKIAAMQADIAQRKQAYAEKERRRIAAEKRAAARKAKEEAEAAKRAACPGYNPEYVAALTDTEQRECEAFYEEGYVFFRQNCSVMKDLPYGDDGFGQCGCGPTVTAALIANLVGEPVTPEDMRRLAIDTHAYIPNVGTTYNFIMVTTAAYGIKATNVVSKEAVCDALKAGKLVLATMGPGDFTLGAHFMLYRGMTDDGKILVADSYSYELSVKEWDWDTLADQLKNGYWIFEKEA